MLPRVLETEAMDTLDEALDYNSMDHGEVNRVFVNDLHWRDSTPRRAKSSTWEPAPR